MCELDSDGCQGTNIETAKGVDYSVKKLDPIQGEKRKLQGNCSNSGGGRVGERLSLDLDNLLRMALNPLLATFSLCGLSLIEASPVEKLIGLGKLKNKNAIQLSFCCCYFQENHELDVF